MSKNNLKTVKGLNYEEFKKSALNYELIQQRVPLAAVTVDTNGGLSINGIGVRSETGVVEKQLVKEILNLNPTLANRFEKAAGGTAKKDFIELMKTALLLTDLKKSEITVVGNPRTQMITNILPGTKDFVSNKIALEMFENTMNAGGADLTLVSAQLSGNGGIELSVKNSDVVEAKTKKGRLVGEEFNAGYNFRSNPLQGMNLSHFVERLVCTNGMTARTIDNEFTLNVLEEGAVRKFFENFMQMSKGGFIPSMYSEQIEKAIGTKASFHELMTARNIMQNNSKLKDVQVNEFLPQFGAVARQLAQRGVDYAKCSDQQLKNFPTSYNVWDVVNNLTWFGSHDTGLEANFSEIQRSAGNLFTKKVYDTENLIVF